MLYHGGSLRPIEEAAQYARLQSCKGRWESTRITRSISPHRKKTLYIPAMIIAVLDATVGIFVWIAEIF